METAYENYLAEAKKENGRMVESIKRSVARNLPKGVRQAKSRIIAIATPTQGMASFWYFSGVINMLWPMNTSKSVLPMIDGVGGEIAEMRNRCVQAMLAIENENVSVEGIFWLDDDVIVGQTALLALVRHDRDIAAGVYFAKGPFSNPLIFGGPSSGTLSYRPSPNEEGPDTTMEAWGWAQGLCYVKLDVYKRTRDELDMGVDKYGAPMWYEPSQFKVVDGQVMTGGTEDFPFFEKCAKLGYQPIVDLTRHAFGYHYDAANDVAFPKAQWDQYRQRLPVVWPAKGEHPEVVWPGLR